MSVLELCDREIAAVPLEATVAEAIHKMLDHHVGAVAVVDSDYRVAGIFTERDVLRKFSLSGRDPAQTPVRELMTTPVELATSQTSPGEAFINMVERHFRHLPVVDNNGKLLGMLSIGQPRLQIDILLRDLFAALRLVFHAAQLLQLRHRGLKLRSRYAQRRRQCASGVRRCAYLQLAHIAVVAFQDFFQAAARLIELFG